MNISKNIYISDILMSLFVFCRLRYNKNNNSTNKKYNVNRNLILLL